jgi:transcriptional regulator with XRE-family HTH domain
MPRLDPARLRRLRQARLLTQAELAARIGATAETVNRLERGKYAARASTIRRLAAALAVEPTELLAPVRWALYEEHRALGGYALRDVVRNAPPHATQKEVREALERKGIQVVNPDPMVKTFLQPEEEWPERVAEQARDAIEWDWYTDLGGD